MKRLAAWTVLALAVVAILGIAREPPFWKRYAMSMMHGGSDLPLSFYQPRERVQGGNLPAAPRVAPALESLDPVALQQAADYAAAHSSRALIVTRHGHIVFERYWQGARFDSMVVSDSFARTLAALLTGIALGERRIGWPDEPIRQFIPEWKDDPRGAITVRNLVQTSSGLAEGGSLSNPWSAAARERFGANLPVTLLESPLVTAPGQADSDRAADSQLLALVIGRAAKERYSQYLSEALWRKIGAGDAWLWLDRDGGTAHADCCLITRLADLVRVGELLVNDGRYEGDEIVPPGWVHQMLTPAPGSVRPGASLSLITGASEPFAARDLFMVAGDGHLMWLVPSMHLVILRSGPAPAGDRAHIPNLIIRGARDYVPAQGRPGTDLSTLVPNH